MCHKKSHLHQTLLCVSLEMVCYITQGTFCFQILYLLKFFHRNIDGGQKTFLLRLRLQFCYAPYTLVNFLLWRIYCINFKQIANESFWDFTWHFMGLKCKCVWGGIVLGGDPGILYMPYIYGYMVMWQ